MSRPLPLLASAAVVFATAVAPASAQPALSPVATLHDFDWISPFGYSKFSDGLAQGVTPSPDGAHVYVPTLDGAVHAFENGVLGELVPIAIYRDDDAANDGIGGATSVAIAPGGLHVYVTGSQDDAVVLFTRDPASGALTWVEAQRDGIGGIDALDGARAVVVSPDGAHVYVASHESDAVAIFARDAGTRSLTFVGAMRDGEGGVSGLDGARTLALSSDGAFLYVGSSKRVELNYSTWSYTGAIAVFSRDPATGSLAFLQSFDEASSPDLLGLRSLALRPDGTALWAAGSTPYPIYPEYSDPGHVVSFARDPATGLLTHLGDVPHYVDWGGARSIVASPDGQYAYVAVERECDRYNFCSLGPLSRLAPSPTTGALELQYAGEDYPFSSSALAVALGPDGDALYLGGRFSIDSSNGSRSPETLARYDRDASSGDATFVGEQVLPQLDLHGAAGVAASADCKNVYVAATNDDTLTTFDVRAASGGLDFASTLHSGVDGVEGLDGPRIVATSPDDRHVYVTSLDGSVSVFARDLQTGSLTFVQVVRDGVDGVDGILAARDLVLSSDGRFVYVAGADDDAVAWFARDEQTGALTWLGALFQGVGGVTGLNGATGLALSPDEANLYVAADGVTVLARDSVSGALSFVQHPATELTPSLALSVAVSPAGDRVYVPDLIWHRLLVFARDAQDGRLTALDSFGGVGTSLELYASRKILVSPEGRRVYVIGGRGYHRVQGDEPDDIAIHVIDRAETGAFAVNDILDMPGLGYGAAMGCDGRFLYASSQIGAYHSEPASNAVITYAVPEPAAAPVAYVAATTLAALAAIVRHRHAT